VPFRSLVKASPEPADTGAVDRRVLLYAICLGVVAGACGNIGDRVPPRAVAPPTSLSNCIEASTARLPYSFCIPVTWRVGETVHTDGSIDIAMIDEAGDILGFAKAFGPVEPSGRVNRFESFPERVTEAQEQRRFLVDAGFKPKFVRDFAIEPLPIDGQPGFLLSFTIDIREPDAVSRFVELRVPVEGGASIELTFVFGASGESDDFVKEVISTLRIDSNLLEEAMRGVRARADSLWQPHRSSRRRAMETSLPAESDRLERDRQLGTAIDSRQSSGA